MFYIAEKIKPRGTRNQTMCSFTKGNDENPLISRVA